MSKLHLVAGRDAAGAYTPIYLGTSRSRAEADFRSPPEGVDQFAAVIIAKNIAVTRRRLIASALPVPAKAPKVAAKKAATKKVAKPASPPATGAAAKLAGGGKPPVTPKTNDAKKQESADEEG